MLPTNSEILALHKRYAPNEKVLELVLTHSTIVTEIALWAAKNSDDPVDTKLLETACMLHDIGSYMFMDHEGHIVDSKLHSLHALMGAKLILDEGIDPQVASLVETHVKMGTSKEEVIRHNLPWPHHDYQTSTVEGELLCYADRFHSKAPIFNTVENYTSFLKKVMPTQIPKFEQAQQKYGVPDIEALSKKYGHQIV